MSRRRTAAAAALTAALLAAGCQSLTPTPAADAGGGTLVLGRNLAGDECRAEPRKGVLGEPGAPAPVDLFCGKAKLATGGLVASFLPLEVPAEEAARRATIARAAASSATGREMAARMACRPGTWSAGPAGDVLVSPCALRSGNWPRIGIVIAAGKLLFLGEGLPADLPVLETAAATLAGFPAPKATVDAARDPSEAIRRLETALGGHAVLFGSDEFDRYGELTQLARLYNSAKNFAAAEAAYRRALEIQTRVLGADSAGAADTLMHLALEVSNQGRFAEAASLFHRAEPIIQRSPDAADRAQLSTYQAYDAANQGRFADALKFAREATALRRSLLPPTAALADDVGALTPVSAIRGEIAHSLVAEAVMSLRLGDIEAGEAAITEALTILAETPNLPPWWRADALAVMGEVNAKRGRILFAERNFRDALAIRQKLSGDTAPTALTWLGLGRTYAREELYPQAIEAYRAAFRIVARDEVARADLVFDQIAPFIDAALAEAKRNPAQAAQLQAEIFAAVQMTAASVSDQTIARASARLATDDPELAELVRSLQEAERRRDSARIELANETAKPDDRRGSLKEAALAKQFRLASAEVGELDGKLRQAFPQYASLAKPADVDLASLQKRLRPGEALLAFQFTREAGYALLARRDGFTAKRLAITEEELRAAVAELRQAFVPRGGAVDDFDLNASYALYRQLLAPIRAELGGIEHLVVVPSGALSSLPLGVLVTEKPRAGAERDYGHAAFLVKQVAVSQVPSIRAFATLRGEGRRSAAKQPFLGVANPVFEGKATAARNQPSSLDALAGQCRDGGPISPNLLRALAPLPETDGEVATIARLLGAGPGSILAGAAASEAAVRGKSLADYRILYFATHGLLPGELRCQSEPGIALTPPREAPDRKEADGLLDASEIAALRIDADLVVLSACNTAQGGGKFGGEALSGLAEAFFHAGARSLLASHWPVPSAQTVRLMTGVFGKLGPDLAQGVAPALRQSQLALLAQPATAHPFFWAAFTLIGDGAGSAALVAAK
jgi:CHAT domain-containing protein